MTMSMRYQESKLVGQLSYLPLGRVTVFTYGHTSTSRFLGEQREQHLGRRSMR